MKKGGRRPPFVLTLGRPYRPEPFYALRALAALRCHAFEKAHYLGFPVPAVPAERPDRGELPGLRPPRDRLRIDAEEGGDLGGGEQRLARRLVPLHPIPSLPGVRPGGVPRCPIRSRAQIVGPEHERRYSLFGAFPVVLECERRDSHFEAIV